ncbi:hypothetical protein Dip510_001660 [Elusimicrobium posterum]|uniref:hypothetical protein n=1 Tax=Elusimicrobium posterum TaxID=3116653 RepID=UPI003C73BCC3
MEFYLICGGALLVSHLAAYFVGRAHGAAGVRSKIDKKVEKDNEQTDAIITNNSAIDRPGLLGWLHKIWGEDK